MKSATDAEGFVDIEQGNVMKTTSTWTVSFPFLAARYGGFSVKRWSIPAGRHNRAFSRASAPPAL